MGCWLSEGNSERLYAPQPTNGDSCATRREEIPSRMPGRRGCRGPVAALVIPISPPVQPPEHKNTDICATPGISEQCRWDSGVCADGHA